MTRHPVSRALARIALAVVVVMTVLEGLLAIFRPESGPLGVLQILAPYLALAGMGAAVLVALSRTRSGFVVAVALLVVVLARFGGNWLSIPPATAAARADQIEAVTWNLEVGSRSGEETVAMLRDHEADLVALQELRPETARAIDGDQELAQTYPYRALVPRDDVGGMGLLSRFPLEGRQFQLDPILQVAMADLGEGRQIAIVNVHPFHADIETLGSSRLPIGLDPAQRNADLVEIRSRVDTLIGRGAPVLLLGDLNTTDSEPAFDRFVAGLRDVHAEVGEGTGWTWRPIRFEFLGLGLFRIDHVIVSPNIVPTGIGVACPAVGDHCLVHAGVALPD